DPQGTDGWCNSNQDCKCAGVGATCNSPHCTFTLPPPPPPADMTMIYDLAGVAPADFSGVVNDLAVASSFDLSAPPDQSGPGTTPAKKSGCAVAGPEPLSPFAALVMSLCGVALLARRVRARSRR